MNLELRLDQLLAQYKAPRTYAVVCDVCGRIGQSSRDHGAVVEAAALHSAETGHHVRAAKVGGGGKRRRAVAAKVGPRGGRTEIQSLLFPRKLWTVEKAKRWARKSGHLYGDVDVTEKYIRLRQSDPDFFQRKRTKCLMKRRGICRIKAVIGVR